jgi:hypothetical protein
LRFRDRWDFVLFEGFPERQIGDTKNCPRDGYRKILEGNQEVEDLALAFHMKRGDAWFAVVFGSLLAVISAKRDGRAESITAIYGTPKPLFLLSARVSDPESFPVKLR